MNRTGKTHFTHPKSEVVKMITLQTLYIGIWLAYSLLVLVMVLYLFSWAKRCDKSPEQNRARYLALWAGIPDKEEETIHKKDEGGRINI